jgi:sarcosine oxidase subunit beta
MVETADVVVIGGGIVGTSIAYHLAKRGVGQGVVLLEKNRLGSGTTGAAVGGIRSQFSTEINVRFSLESVRFWRQFEEELGLTADYREMGYLFVAQTQDEREQFIRNIAMQNAMGVPSELLEPEAAGRLVPGMRTDDLTAAAYNATDGRGGPYEATTAFAKRARDGGVRIKEGVAATGIETSRGRVRAVETTAGRFETAAVVNAAGPWAGPVGALAGIDVPVKPFRREIFVSEPFDALPKMFPNLIDLHVGWYVWREGAGVLMSGIKDSHPSYDTHVSRDSLATVGEFATHRVPALKQARWGKRAWAGLYDVSPDDHAILGTVPDLEGFYVAAGFSGHGFQHSPATGRLMAELILDGRTTGIDISPVNIARFKSGALLQESLTAHAGTMSG